MKNQHPGLLDTLVRSALTDEAADAAFAVLRLSPALTAATGPQVHRAVMAMALNVVLFADLIRRAPTGAAYVDDVRRAGQQVVFDHGALRTIRFPDGPTGGLPQGEAAFTRLLAPLGYALAGLYPLDRLGMTGRAYLQADMPEDIPQFFLSELHVERFSKAFQAAAERVFQSSVDPLGIAAFQALEAFAQHREAPLALARAALPELAAAFGRHHQIPRLEDYEILLEESKEAAWIATEGNAFNHATDRVPNVDVLAEVQRGMGRPMKDAVEVSRSGRVRQTAFRADMVDRSFRTEHGEIWRPAPGSFYEFITRSPLPDGSGRLDLSFDSGNAQGIFKMTSAV